MIRLNLAGSWCDALRRDGTLPVEWLAILSRPVNVVPRGVSTSHSIEASPEMWDMLLAWGHQRRTVPLGASKSDEDFAVMVGRLVAKVTKGLDRMAKHPGYQGRAIRSHSAVVLPAYRCKHPRARWWPTPRMAVVGAEGESLELQSGWLVPEQKSVRGSLVTKWVFDSNHPSYYSEATTPMTKEATDG